MNKKLKLKILGIVICIVIGISFAVLYSGYYKKDYTAIESLTAKIIRIETDSQSIYKTLYVIPKEIGYLDTCKIRIHSASSRYRTVKVNQTYTFYSSNYTEIKTLDCIPNAVNHHVIVWLMFSIFSFILAFFILLI